MQSSRNKRIGDDGAGPGTTDTYSSKAGRLASTASDHQLQTQMPSFALGPIGEHNKEELSNHRYASGKGASKCNAIDMPKPAVASLNAHEEVRVKAVDLDGATLGSTKNEVLRQKQGPATNNSQPKRKTPCIHGETNNLKTQRKRPHYRSTSSRAMKPSERGRIHMLGRSPTRTTKGITPTFHKGNTGKEKH